MKIGIVSIILISSSINHCTQGTNEDLNKKQISEKTEVVKYQDTSSEKINKTEQNNNENYLNLKFIEEGTGYAIIPDKIELSDKNNSNNSFLFDNNKISKNGSFGYNIPNGNYYITVTEKNHKTMSTDFNVINQEVNLNFHLVPLTPISELSPDNIMKLHKKNYMTILGFVVDDFTGSPIENLDIYTADKTIKTKSNQKGYFQFEIPLLKNETEIKNKGVIIFNKNGYFTEELEDFDMYSEGDAIFKIRMKLGMGTNISKVIDHREVNREFLNNK